MSGKMTEFQTEIDNRPRLRGELSRRRVLKAASAIGLAHTGYRIDQAVTLAHWAHSDTAMYTLPGRAPNTSSHGWLAAPGYGSIHGAHMARQVRSNRAIPASEPVGSFVYGNTAVTPRDIRTGARRYAAAMQLATMSVYCHSMGGLIGLTGAHAAGLPLRRIILNASPKDIDDADMAEAAKAAALLSKITGYHGSLASKYAGALFTRFHQHGAGDLQSFIDNFTIAGKDAWNGADPQCMDSQLMMLDDSKESLDFHDFRHIIIPGLTKAVYCLPRHPEDDRTVQTLQAADKWENEFFGPLGVPLQRLYLPLPRDPSMAHANTDYAMEYTAEFITTGRISDHYPAP